MNQIEIYKGENNETQIEVKFEEGTVWLTQKQLAELFKNTVPNINMHIRNVYEEKELTKKSTIKKSLIVQKEGKRLVNRMIELYNLDVIISVGYRVKSIQGTKFRQWATQRLKDYLVEGYAINQERLNQLQKTIQLIESTGKTDELSLNEAKGLLNIITNYTNSFVLLNRFDSHELETTKLSEEITYQIKYPEAVNVIKELKKVLVSKREATGWFGKEKDKSLEGLLGNIVQSFAGNYLYRSIEEQASHLLYFIIKNHPFTDGNKRIGAFLFIWFLQKNKHRFKRSGEVKINDNGLTALALLVAQSNPNDKELMIKLIVNLINGQ